MEFLLTYGWAILIISVAALLMWQLGLFNITGQIPQGSSGFWGVVPHEDFRYRSDGTLTIPISNKVGGTIIVRSVNVSMGSTTVSDDKPTDYMTEGNDITPGSIKIWERDIHTYFQPLPEGSNYHIFVSIGYNDTRVDETYMSSGWLRGNTEAT